jgi:hypothetical protein
MHLGGRIALLVLLVVVGALTTTAASGAPGAACWQRLLRDWSDGRISGTYPVSCYQAALRKMPEDLRIYSSAPDDLRAALQRTAARRGAATGSRRLAGVGNRMPAAVAGRGSEPRLPILLGASLGGLGLLLGTAGVVARLRSR